MTKPRPPPESAAPADLEMSELMRRSGELSGRYVEARSAAAGGRSLTRAKRRTLLNLACLVQNHSTALIAALIEEKEVDSV